MFDMEFCDFYIETGPFIYLLLFVLVMQMVSQGGTAFDWMNICVFQDQSSTSLVYFREREKLSLSAKRPFSYLSI